MARVVVVGGGLSGLTAAFRLARAQQTVLVIDSGAQLGGQIRTERQDGFVVELGAEGFVARSEVVPKLARDLGIESELIGQSLTRSLGFRGGQLHELAPGEAGSLLGFQVARDSLGAGIRTFRSGMGRLIEALEARLSNAVEWRRGFRVKRIERRAKGYEISGEDGVTVKADRVVVATSVRGAAEILLPVLGSSALDLARVTTNSSVTVSLAFERDAIAQPLDATGIVVATADQLHGARACTFTDSKFEGRAPAGHVCLRVFMRPDEREQKMLADATYVARANEVITHLLGPSGPSLRSWVSRWPDALPVFDPASKQAVAALETALKGSGIALAGSAYHGAGIDAAIRSANTVQERLKL
jgi:oxygen-dependent protoporphyrinogen oxidase